MYKFIIEFSKGFPARPLIPGWMLAVFLVLTPWAVFAQTPTFEGFSPREQVPGAAAEWRGAHLEGVKRVLMGSTECRFTVSGEARVLRFQVPLDAAPGPRLVTVYFSEGPGEGASLKAKVADRPFLVLRSPAGDPEGPEPAPGPVVPVFQNCTPSRTWNLEEAVITGEHLDLVREIRVGARPCAILPGRTGTRLRFQVPAETPRGRGAENRLSLVYATGLPEPATQVLETPCTLLILPPQVRELGPLSGPPGTNVTLMGEGLLNIRSVRFGELEVPFRIVNATTLQARIPAVPLTGGFLLTGANGATAVTRSRFHVTGLERLPPAFHGDFKPAEGRAGDRIEVTGDRLHTVLKVWVGGKASTELTHDGEHRLAFTVPAGAEPGLPVALEYAREAPGSRARVESDRPFRVIPPRPVISKVDPVDGPAGTPVVITGAHFDELVAVHFGTTRATSILRATPTEIWVAAPEGTREGIITLETRSGTAHAPAPFTPAAPAPLTVDFAALYVTQAVQRRDGSVPLVAGKDGVLRIFLQASRGNAYRPAIRVTLRNTGEEPREWYLPASGPGVPTRFDEDRLSASWNLPLPGSLIKPGATLLAETAAGPAGSPSGETIRRFPVTGTPLALDVRVVPPLRISFIPLCLENTPGEPVGAVATTDLPDLLAFLRAIYPVSEVDARVEPVWSIQEDCRSLDSCSRALEALDARRRAAPGPENARYHFGVFKLPETGELHGKAFIGDGTPGGAGMGEDSRDPSDENPLAFTLAHELGHALGRLHAPDPRVEPDSVDPAYPHQDGSIGASGFDVARMKPLAPSTHKDVMGYAQPRWISDHTYEALLAYLTRTPAPAPAAAAPGIIP